MFALIACIVFAVWAFGGHIGTINLEAVGLFFLALELAYGWGRPFINRSRTP